MRKKLCLLAVFTICILLTLFFLNKENKKEEGIPNENGTITLYFCPTNNCEEILLQKMQNATETIHCAFYNLNLPAVSNILQEKYEQGRDVRLIIDRDHKSGLENLPFVSFDTRSALMHNKFCIFDSQEVMTGSMNPTITDAIKNNNNLVFIQSKYLAQNYEEEFQSFLEGDFGSDTFVRYPTILLNESLIENYFCPEDACEEHIIDALEHANTSIYFMTYSFTSDAIGSLLLKKSTTIPIAGIFEKQQGSSYSEYWRLQELNVTFDSNPTLLHHKVFIIDENVVITGSMNPSRNGNERNDENILIIHDPVIAHHYLQEFYALFP